ncbi:hypothetical protein [Mycobacterium sp. 360MFTsu5.1]|uniref:hypothetical protein n=1 Tax=Mycobacterium sp. 360MFTsu5.1 TaxID=1172186 RepID=UPI00036D813D|nr:hypothetical protein [Mycobacterium sp. 360MFTsu5.1]
MTSQLPDDVEQIIEHLARWAKGYRNRLKWNEEAKFKSDLMEVRDRWSADRVPAPAFHDRCIAHGMTKDDADTLTGHLKKAQAGRRLIPQHSYRGFRFSPDPAD